MKYGICSLYANPIHGGHITYLQESAALVDELLVIVNSDAQVEVKGSVPFMNEGERHRVVSNIKGVDHAFISTSDESNVAKDIEEAVDWLLDEEKFRQDIVGSPKFYFFNSGDVVRSNEEELRVCRDKNVVPVFLDLKKENSSSRLIERAQILE